MIFTILQKRLWILISLVVGIVVFLIWQLEASILLDILRSIARPENDVEKSFFDIKITSRLYQLKIGFSIAILSIVPLIYFTSSKISKSLNSCVTLAVIFKDKLANIVYKERVLLGSVIALFFICGVFLIWFLPVHFDEAYSYMYYIRKGPLVVSTLYNSTNNHIFYNLIASILYKTLGGELLLLRFINLLVSVITLLALFVYMRQRTSFLKTILTVIGLVLTLGFWYYAIQVRGYAFVIFLSFVSMILMIRLIDIGDDISRYGFVISTVLGLYTMPTYILVFGSQSLFLWMNLRERKSLIIICGYILGLYAILMVPVILVSGISFITSNPQIEWIHDRFRIAYFPFYIWTTYTFLFGLIPLLIFSLTELFVRLKNKGVKDCFYKKVNTYFIILIVIILIAPFINFAYPPARVFVFSLIPFIIISLLIIDYKAISFVFVMAIGLSSFISADRLMEYSYLSSTKMLYNKLCLGSERKIHFYHHPTMRVMMDYYDRDNHQLNISSTPMGEDIKLYERQTNGIIFTPYEDIQLGNQPLEINTYYCVYPLKPLDNG